LIQFDSDKFYWHRYVDFYEDKCFSRINPRHILEFGVLRGESIRYLNMRFPSAEIIGVDKDPVPIDCPKHGNISYIECNQNDRDAIKRILFAPFMFDLIIDDGSHNPLHQVTCLCESVYRMGSGSYYIVEDIHTNLNVSGSLLHFLLMLEQHQALKKHISDENIKKFSETNVISEKDMRILQDRIKSVQIFHRTSLPLKCWSCPSSEYNYLALTCSCGLPLYQQDDSMSALLELN